MKEVGPLTPAQKRDGPSMQSNHKHNKMPRQANKAQDAWLAEGQITDAHTKKYSENELQIAIKAAVQQCISERKK